MAVRDPNPFRGNGVFRVGSVVERRRRFLEGRKDAMLTQQIAKARIADTSRQG